MKRPQIAAIVEGDGEVAAVPILIRRIWRDIGYTGALEIPESIRRPASTLKRPSELEKAVELAARKIGGWGGIFVLVDSDGDCPAKLGPQLLAAVRRTRSDVPSSVVLAHREFESWFLGSAVSLRNVGGLSATLENHPSPESKGGCKEWLGKQKVTGRKYVEVIDQAVFTQKFDLNQARLACSSFDKCYRDLAGLLHKVAKMNGLTRGAA